MRIQNDEIPSTDFSDYLEKVKRGEEPPPPHKPEQPIFITEEEQAQLMAEGNWSLPPALERSQNKEIDGDNT